MIRSILFFPVEILRAVCRRLFVRHTFCEMCSLDFRAFYVIKADGGRYRFTEITQLPPHPLSGDDLVKTKTLSFSLERIATRIMLSREAIEDVQMVKTVYDHIIGRLDAAFAGWPESPEAEGFVCFAVRREDIIEWWRQEFARWLQEPCFPDRYEYNTIHRRWLLFKRIETTVVHLKFFQIPRPNDAVVKDQIERILRNDGEKGCQRDRLKRRSRPRLRSC